MKRTEPSAPAAHDGPCRFVNLYLSGANRLSSGVHSYPTLEAARKGRDEDGTYVCTARISTTVEIV